MIKKSKHLGAIPVLLIKGLVVDESGATVGESLEIFNSFTREKRTWLGSGKGEQLPSGWYNIVGRSEALLGVASMRVQ